MLPDNSAHNRKFHSGNFSAMSDTLLSGKRCFVLDDEFLIALDIQQILENRRRRARRVRRNRAGSRRAAAPRTELRCCRTRHETRRTATAPVSASRTLLAENGTPFVFLTGMRVDDLHAKQFPQAPVIEKPYDAAALLDAIRRALAKN